MILRSSAPCPNATTQNIQVSFTFETTSTNNNSGLGVLVDDLVVGTTCEAKPCSSNGTCSSLDTCLTGVCAASACTYVNSCCYADDECDDAQVCTVDSCSNGKCNFLPEPGCCEDLDDCSDGNPCTTDMCSGFGGSCSWEDVPGCCLSHADCNDGNECTQDKCSDDVCLNIDVCCESDDECDDGDDVCTVDACVSQFCSFEPTGADGCCESNPLTWDFESPINLDISSSTACTWAVVDSAQNQTQGGGKLLRYSKPGSNNYDCSLNSGTAVTEPFELQEGVAYTLSIKLMMDTETSTSYDKLFIYAVTNDKEIELWNKASLSAGKAQWGTYEFNFNAFAGEEVKLKFYFNSVDSVLNGTSGVFVDDITVTSTCLPAPCDSASDCSDGLNATTESCAGVGCDYTIP